MSHKPFMPISVPERIEVGPHKGKFAFRFKDEHGLVQSDFPYYTKEIAWAISLAKYCKYNKIKLVEIPQEDLHVGDLIIDSSYNVLQIDRTPATVKNIFNEETYAAIGVHVSELPKTPIQIIIRKAFKLPENEDFTF